MLGSAAVLGQASVVVESEVRQHNISVKSCLATINKFPLTVNLAYF